MANRKNTRNKASSKKTTDKSKQTKKKNNTKKQQKDWYLIHVIALIVLSLIMSVFIYIDTGEGGFINQAVKNHVFGMFGWTGHIVPLVIIGYLAYLFITHDVKKLWKKIGLSTLAVVNLSSILALSARYDMPEDAMVEGATNMCGGGYIGALIGNGIENLIQIVLAYILLIVTLIILISFIASFPLFSYIKLGIDIISGKAQDAYYENPVEKIFSRKK